MLALVMDPKIVYSMLVDMMMVQSDGPDDGP